MHDEILDLCRNALPGWRELGAGDLSVEAPKGFSSYTLTIRANGSVDPPAIFYRRLEGKENAILEPALEREVFLLLGDEGIAARCYGYEADYRLEAFYPGRTLRADDLHDPDVLAGLAARLHRFHRLRPERLPEDDFFTLLHRKWGRLAQRVLTEQLDRFPEHERHLGEELRRITTDETAAMVRRFLPDGALTFCHNDTYHGNAMLLDGPEGVADRIRLLDFEFSCRNHRAFDFANLFAETAMRHGLPEYPHFAIAKPTAGEREIRMLVAAYVGNDTFDSDQAREAAIERLVGETLSVLPLSHYMYAMAAIPLAVEPIQKIRFLPYAHQRFAHFVRAHDERFDAV